jgi:N-acetylglucosaminyldiphosphoundecaprenol N-acetyl-beta-D-mannosaminyltransferase
MRGRPLRSDADSGGDAHRSKSIRLLGVRVDRLDLAGLLGYVRAAIRQPTHVSIMYVNVHCMNMRRRDDQYRGVLEHADLVYCDGTGVQLAARLHGLPVPERMTGADWIHDLCRLAVRDDLSLYFVAGRPGLAEEAALALRTRYLGLRIAGTAAGYDAGEETVRAVNAAHPDILLVGMGTPTQEKWIVANRSQLGVPVVWAVGALFEFVAGRIRRGPHWMTDHGLEWLCRLVVEPRKLWRRYLLGIPWFFWRVIRGASA